MPYHLFLLLLFISKASTLWATTGQQYQLMLIADIHLGAKQKMDVKPNSYNANNDLDSDTFHLLLKKVDALIQTNQIGPNGLLILGDLVNHKDSHKTQGSVNTRIRQLKQSFKSLYDIFEASTIPLSYVYGNNDALSGNYDPFYLEGKTTYHSPYEIAKEEGWSFGYLSSGALCEQEALDFPCIHSEHQEGGYYSEYLAADLKLISLNTVLFAQGKHCESACHLELAWLKNALKEAAEKNESVLIAMHIPPGFNRVNNTLFWNVDAQNKFLQILFSYKVNILSLLVAHTHMEEVQMIRSENRPIIPIIYTAGLSTSHGNLPSFKTLRLTRNPNTKAWSLDNFTSYHYIDQQFKIFYHFKKAYCSAYQTKTISLCLETMLKTNWLQDYIEKINQYFTVGNSNYPVKLPKQTERNFIITFQEA